MMRKLLCGAFLMICLAAVCLMPAVAENEDSGTFTTDNWTYELTEEGTIRLTGTSLGASALKIPAEIDGRPVTAVGQMAFTGEEGNTPIKKISIAEGVLTLEHDAFNGLPNLDTVTLPDSVTEIGERAFYDCRKLRIVSMPANLQTIGDDAFFNCLLRSIAFPEGLKTIGNEAFCLCALNSITFPEGLETIGRNAFTGLACKVLVIPASVRIIGDEAFSSGRMPLRKVVFQGGDTVPGNKIFGYATYSDGTTYGYYSSPLPSFLKIPELIVVCVPGSPADQMYQYSVVKQYPKWDETHVFTAPAEAVIGTGLLRDEEQVYEIIIPEGVEEIADNTFADLRTLCRVSLPSTLKKIGRNAFSGCTALTEITLPEGLTVLGEACFSGCSSLTRVSIPAGIEEIPKEAFARCFRLAELKLPDGLKTIGDEAFSQDGDQVVFVYEMSGGKDAYCALESVKLPASLKTIGMGAFGCNDALKTVLFREGSQVKEAGDYAFAKCVRLKRMDLPEGMTTLGSSVFLYDFSLEVLTVPDSVTEIGKTLLNGCSQGILVVCGEGSAMDQYVKQYEGMKVKYKK